MQRRVGAAIGEVAFVGALVLFLGFLAFTAYQNLIARNIATGFTFLFRETGWDVSATWISHSARDPYWWTFVVGLANTLAIGLLAIVVATTLGVAFALLRSLENRLLSMVISVYIGIIRNIPLIVQIFFWYAFSRQFPSNRDAVSLFGIVHASNRGFFLPSIHVELAPLAAAVIVLVVSYIVVTRWNAKRDAIGAGRIPRSVTVVLALACFLLFLIINPGSFTSTIPVLRGFNFVGGVSIAPELGALLLGIIIYNTAFIAEIVRSGIRSVPNGQIEAARNIGLTKIRVFRKIVFPQAMRVIVPPLINQYANIMKASALAVAIGFPDLFAIGTVTINHTGQSLEVMVILMVVYFGINRSIAAIGNAYDRSIIRKWRR